MGFGMAQLKQPTLVIIIVLLLVGTRGSAEPKPPPEVIFFPAGTFDFYQTTVVSSNTVIEGAGPETVLRFHLSGPQVACVNDRAFTTPCGSRYLARRRIVGPIVKGSSCFQVLDATDAADLSNGDWIFVEEKDIQVGDPVVFDWAQIESVNGNQVCVQQPFRSTFPNLRTWDPIRGGLTFTRFPTVTQNVQFRNFTLIVDSAENAPAISVFAAKDTTIDNVVVNDPNGQPLYSYLSKGLTITNSSASAGATISEFAATVDLAISGTTFSATNTAALALDLGTGFFDVSSNFVSTSQSFGIYATNGAHDGRIYNNYIATVHNPGGSAVGILARGVQRIKIQRNTLAGGEGTSIGISIGKDYNLEVPIVSLANKLYPNSFGSWTTNFEPPLGSYNFQDNKTDFGVYRTGLWLVRGQVSWGIPGDIAVPADYDGDGKADYAVFRPSDGKWYIINSHDGSYSVKPYGADVPVPGDYDGDLCADIATYQSGLWTIQNSSDGVSHFLSWGLPGDIPVPADYDGDGITDVAVYRPATGNWYIIRSSDGEYRQVAWGLPGDIPVPGDYDGDGCSDLAIWRPSSATWFILNSSDGSYRVQTWGSIGDTPVPADYDGDQKFDLAVWKSGSWSILKSGDGGIFSATQGVSGDVPLPLPWAVRRNFYSP